MEDAMSNGDISFLVVIGERKLKENFIVSLTETGATVFNVMYGKGFVKSNDFLAAFGFVNEKNKVIVTCLIKKSDCDKTFDMLNKKFKFDCPNTGIAFTIAVDALKY
ncbi:MAG: hypothetical protein LBQ27_04455 [Clostridiales bacterium]|jgi:hypothetical protein|nr:hypothetical protein [Clostridiales bacterium]